MQVLGKQQILDSPENGGEGEVKVFSTKRWDHRSSEALIESATCCHDAQMVGPYRVSNPLRLTALAAKSEESTTAPHLPLIEVITKVITY